MGFWIAAWTVIPGIQILAVAALALMPARKESVLDDSRRLRAKHRLEGLLAGIAIIVLGVFVSALAFGAYGWGLFVLAPFTVGLTTAYLANRSEPIDFPTTTGLVMAAAALGSLALILHALEGLACLILAAPLASLMAFIGGGLGWSMAQATRRRRKPLLAVAFLPAVFALEAAVPPAAAIATDRSIEIDAPPAAVWRALTSEEPVRPPPGLPAQAGFAYPLSGRIISGRAGGERVGLFSTGPARERITLWEPGHRLAFIVVEQPAAMEEMSPYRRVHAPHVEGYFENVETSFELEALPGGRSRLTARASTVLRIDPIPYWEPIAHWAIRSNLARVLEDYRLKAEGAVRRS
ncbi:hypothetical protein [Sphingosinicella terrae]|uniref:hypothetical protein n=1 Tax=Sphingosinicella terrae TaxID=2172047 RepID=UPI0013B46B7C|nr:hypothetical protein [Sphingosinicella terrae]